MAAYGALVSVMQIIDQIQHHPQPPISLHDTQSESLTANVTFLQEFLEGYNPRVIYSSEADPLESRIAEAAYAAEDVIENYIVDQIHARSTDHVGKISSTEFYQGLENVIEEMDLIKVEVMEKKMQVAEIIKKQSATEAASSRSSSTAQKVGMVGLDDVLYEMLEKITRGLLVRLIIPIVGMGGLGKTTLARNIYANPLVKEHFDICAWSTISQVHNTRKILTEIIGQVDMTIEKDLSEYELGEQLYRYLIGRRYLIVMDDMWSIEAWDRVRSFFPENENGSRVIVTTRLLNLASEFNYSNGLDMKFMDEATSWNLFCKTVFGDELCPLELVDIGKKILEGCEGLPLSIVVVGGLLSKSEATRENWQVIGERLSSVVNSEDDGSCLQTLYTSYNNLLIHIKPCFLYMGVYPEDLEIIVILLIPLMVAEGFLKPIGGKSLEETAEEYLEELVDRDVETIKIHDLLRDLALREGEKDKFVCALEQSSGDREISQGMISGQRRITNSLREENTSSTHLLEYVEAATVRTLIGKFGAQILPVSRFRLLRVCMVDLVEDESSDEYYEEILIRLLNLRLLVVDVNGHQLPKVLPYLWNLQLLHLSKVGEDYVLDIWKMPLLRQVVTSNAAFCLSDPPLDEERVLANLRILVEVRNLKLSEEVLKLIPDIKVLFLYYKEGGDDYCLNNLHRLNKLQDLRLTWRGSDSPLVKELHLLHSLKHLTLKGTKLPWEVMASKIGWLPLLQVLMLEEDSFTGSEWETVEGQFSSLKFLRIERCGELVHWMTDNTHFPRLEHLVLRFLKRLREIPLSIGDIPTLRSIELTECSEFAEESALIIQGFVKPIDGKSLEEAAEEYLQELVDRNLVIAESHDRCGDVEIIKIHDLLRDLALREGEKDKFVWSREISQGMTSGQRRILNSFKEENSTSSTFLVEAAATLRTLIGKFGAHILPISRFRLLRACVMVEDESNFNDEYYEDILIRLLNLRLLIINTHYHPLPRIPCCIWNLQTLKLVVLLKNTFWRFGRCLYLGTS